LTKSATTQRRRANKAWSAVEAVARTWRRAAAVILLDIGPERLKPASLSRRRGALPTTRRAPWRLLAIGDHVEAVARTWRRAAAVILLDIGPERLKPASLSRHNGRGIAPSGENAKSR
jgi:hypothetical protein